jgi:tRNA pseudouridine38-40 synthase
MVSQMGPSRKLALWVWYRGDFFRGYQTQPVGPTVQQSLTSAFRSIGLEKNPVPAGRTDKGVSARMQVVSFRAPRDFVAESLLRLPLPEGVGLCTTKWAPLAFHPQWSAVQKEYRYRICVAEVPPGPWSPFAFVTQRHPRLKGKAIDVERLSSLLKQAEGSRDFSAFHENSSPRKIRALRSATLHALGRGVYEARLCGDSFGRYQVRYLVGSACAAAAGDISDEDYVRALDEAKPLPGLKAPAEALVLWEVKYPEAVDPFSAEERSLAVGLPEGPPFTTAA